MSETKKPSRSIQPSVFEAPGKSATPKSSYEANSSANNALLVKHGAPWWHSQFNVMLCVFALLVLAVLSVIALIPKPSASSYNTVLTSTGESKVTEQTVSQAEQSQAPWSESRKQQARSDTQDVLAELLTLKKELEAKTVLDWARSEFESSLALADQGDEFYKAKDFPEALKRYQRALEEMQSIGELIPLVVQKRVSSGNQALSAGKSSLAKEKFQQALALEQNNIPALTGLDRASTLDKVLALMQSAQLDEQEFAVNDQLQSIVDAQQKYQQAIAIDARSELALTAQQRVATLMLDKQYRLAMSAGFNALFANQYSQAKNGFAAALKLKPNDGTATAAYRQSLASDKRSSVRSLIANANAFEKREEWGQAVSTYQAVLQRDPNQVSAKLGTIRSNARSELDQSIRGVLQDPLSLSKATQRVKAEDVLNDARAIKKTGPVLKGQISQLESIFSGLDTNLKVELNSDSFTAITLLKDGAKKIRLGTFSQKKMALKPGRYVLSGSRLGYVDVRREINLEPGANGVLVFSIACKTPINSAASVGGEL